MKWLAGLGTAIVAAAAVAAVAAIPEPTQPRVSTVEAVEASTDAAASQPLAPGASASALVGPASETTQPDAGALEATGTVAAPTDEKPGEGDGEFGDGEFQNDGTSSTSSSTSSTSTTAPKSSSGKSTTPTTTPVPSGTTPPPPAPPPPATSGPVVISPKPTGGITSLVIAEDTMIKTGMVLRAGDSIEFRNGARLMFGPGGFADWQGTVTSTWSNDGKTQNLERDIEIFGSGDIMFMKGSLPSTIRFVEVDLQPKQELAHYPLHWHHAGTSVSGTLVEGVVVKNSTNRAFVPHASTGITFKDTIATNIQGDAYWWDRPPFQSEDESENSHNIVFDHALADGVRNHFTDDRGYRLSAFFLGAGTGNVVRNSVALNVKPSHPNNCAGFVWPETHHSQPTSWGFLNNASFHSACNGIFTWQNDGEEHIIDGFRGDGIEHGAYKNVYDYRNVDVSFVKVHALGWTINGGSIGHVQVQGHTLAGGPVVFSNLTIGSFAVNNGGRDNPGTYVLNNTNLSCGDIVYQSVKPGTRVVIDGKDC